MEWSELTRDNFIFLLIDFQEKFFPLMDKRVLDRARENILLLVKMFKLLGVPMVGSEHYVQGLGHTEGRILQAWGDAPMFPKTAFSCYREPGFRNELEEHSYPFAVVAGLETHICVFQTVLDMQQEGYQVAVLLDAVVSSSKLYWQNGLDLMKDSGAKIMNTETLLFYLLERAGTKEFKHLVRLLKERQVGLL